MHIRVANRNMANKKGEKEKKSSEQVYRGDSGQRNKERYIFTIHN